MMSESSMNPRRTKLRKSQVSVLLSQANAIMSFFPIPLASFWSVPTEGFPVPFSMRLIFHPLISQQSDAVSCRLSVRTFYPRQKRPGFS